MMITRTTTRRPIPQPQSPSLIPITPGAPSHHQHQQQYPPTHHEATHTSDTPKRIGTTTRPVLSSNPSSANPYKERKRGKYRDRDKAGSGFGLSPGSVTILKRGATGSNGTDSSSPIPLDSSSSANVIGADSDYEVARSQPAGSQSQSQSQSAQHTNSNTRSSATSIRGRAQASTSTSTTSTLGVEAEAEADFLTRTGTTAGTNTLNEAANYHNNKKGKVKAVVLDGSTTPRAGGSYLYQHHRDRDEGEGEGEGDDDRRVHEDYGPGGEDVEGEVPVWYIDQYGQRSRWSPLSSGSALSGKMKGDALQSAKGEGRMEWYIDNYGKRTSRMVDGSTSASLGGYGRGLDLVGDDLDEEDGEEGEGEGEEEEESHSEDPDADENDHTGTDSQQQQQQQQAIDHRGALTKDMDLASPISQSTTSTATPTKAKKRKSKKKRKIPVTVPLPLALPSSATLPSSAALASAAHASTASASTTTNTIAHSHSVPNLQHLHVRDDSTTDTDLIGINTTTEEEEEGEDGDVDGDLRSASASSSLSSEGTETETDSEIVGSGGDRSGAIAARTRGDGDIGVANNAATAADVKADANAFPGLGPGLGLGLGLGVAFVEDVSIDELTKKEKKRLKKERQKEKKKEKRRVKEFVIRGDPMNSPAVVFSNDFASTVGNAGEKGGVLFGQQSKTTKLVLLAKYLWGMFDGERDVLSKVLKRLEASSMPSYAFAATAAEDDWDGFGPSTPRKNKKKEKGKRRVFLPDDGSLEYSSLASSDLQRAVVVERGDGSPSDGYGYAYGEKDDPDPRGDPPGRKDVLVHVFIDHSNILIGLLNHLKRVSKKLKIPPPPASSSSSSSAKNNTYHHDASPSISSGTALRPLPIPKTKVGVPIPVRTHKPSPVIPLPSFATSTSNLSRSAPSTITGKSSLSTVMAARRAHQSSDDDEDDVQVFEFEDEGYGYEVDRSNDLGKEGMGTPLTGKRNEKRSKGAKAGGASKAAAMIRRSPHLWHAALALVLERGRPVTRRVVVASSPLYQPMEDMERLGYDVSVLTRVPDLGDGADRLEKAAKFEALSSSSFHAKDTTTTTTEYHSGSSPTKGGFAATQQQARTLGKSQARRILNISDNAGSASGSPGAASQSTRVKYREQGVDELLQLKLLTVIAATDRVPEGSTIVLATGDGNVGQFNEDGYLGPVRMALKHGWKVELYAWEDGLSRSWKREFGPTSEWGKKGMFRVIAMEQFAECLVDLGY
ncbi:hypothetical protein NP233_g5841 [Leucocoprinus birnbaumii]|uniref:Uncharacterized protein n=1 Tax=Leucocoprinus birnbaumii TaxID=56174 RepID=A0AAD5VS39_9AGAR|nr:hypothetical protein NP233_g5841 [Leucocoprinus birnbaumii]